MLQKFSEVQTQIADSFMLHTTINYWKSISFTCLLFYLSFARPASFEGLNVVNITDKVAHYVVYVIYGILLIYDYLKDKKNDFSKKDFIFLCIIMPIILGGLIEIVQEAFFKPRSAEWIDWFCDILGILTAWLMYYFIKKKTKILSKL